MREIYIGQKTQMRSMTPEELYEYIKTFYSIPELQNKYGVTTSDLVSFLELEYGIVDYISKADKTLRNVLHILVQDGYMKKDRGYQWCGGKTYIWSLV